MATVRRSRRRRTGSKARPGSRRGEPPFRLTPRMALDLGAYIRVGIHSDRDVAGGRWTEVTLGLRWGSRPSPPLA